MNASVLAVAPAAWKTLSLALWLRAESEAPTPEPTPTSDLHEVAEQAVAATVDIAQLLGVCLLGALIGWVIAVVIVAVVKAGFRRHTGLIDVVRGIQVPAQFTLAVVGARFGLFSYMENFPEQDRPNWSPVLKHLLLLLIIAGLTWLLVGVVNGAARSYLKFVERVAETRYRRVQTQLQILRRLAVALIIVIGLAAMLMTYPGAKAAGASLFASAGVISLVVGIAAQSTLGTLFAGLQLAFSDSIRVNDIVIWDGNMCTVEEITLSYVVLKVWDGRRLIVPSNKLTSTTFENWSRRDLDIMGSVVLQLDWSAPIAELRAELDRILANTDLWDGDTGILVVGDASNPNGLQVSAIVSASSPGELTDLRNHVREKLIVWLQTNAPDAFPHTRFYNDDAASSTAGALTGESDSEQQGAELEQPGSDSKRSKNDAVGESHEAEAGGSEESKKLVAGSSGERAESEEHPESDAHAESKAQAKSKKRAKSEKQARPAARSVTRTSIGAQEQTEPDTTFDPQDYQETRILSASDIEAAVRPERVPVASRPESPAGGEGPATRIREGHEASLFTGSIQAEKRGQEFSGPGADVLAEREHNAARRTGQQEPIHEAGKVPSESSAPPTAVFPAVVGETSEADTAKQCDAAKQSDATKQSETAKQAEAAKQSSDNEATEERTAHGTDAPAKR
ncbi:mechanosensitive ion channel domain-containing protein [Actinotignum schaalii]|uniref:mechanosensitive ion channel domain-containing protein n=1 Tax=Actinotignum schaalii TaxID=59505 RepID=UPI000419EEFE|nr:mechanosensitive ion channel domain-containing protein [Actinotignum schaalii]WQN44967.1 mechanosensitive ion channel [Actinotignum schaalii]